MSRRPKSRQPKGFTLLPHSKGHRHGVSDRIKKVSRAKVTNKNTLASLKSKRPLTLQNNFDALQAAIDCSINVVYAREITSNIERVISEFHQLKDAYNRLRDAMEPIEQIANGMCDKREPANPFSGTVKILMREERNVLEAIIQVLMKDSMDMARYMLRL